MPDLNAGTTATRSLPANLLQLFSCISLRRKFQIGILFMMQIISGALEILSIGAIIPFLSALTDTEKLMGNRYIAILVERAQITDPQQLIMVLALLFSAGIVFANLFRFFTLLTQQYLSAHIASDLGKMLLLKTLHKPYTYFLNNNSGHMIANMTNDLNGTLGTLYNLFSFVTQSLIAIFVAGGLLIYKPQIALILSLVVVISYSIIMFLVRRRLRRNSFTASDSYRNSLQTLQESFGGIRYILMSRLQKNFTDQFFQTDRGWRIKNAENSVITQAPRFFLESVGVIAIAGITIAFTAQNINIAEIIPLMGFLVFGCYRLLPAVQQIYASLGTMLSVSASLERVVDVIAAPISADQTEPVKNPLKMEKSLRFENIFFNYRQNDEDWTVQDLNIDIGAKTTVALVGHTGSGKSTISDLILGLLQPQKGQILVDGIALDQTNIARWQAGISHVPQSIFLSDASIAENIAFGIPRKHIDMAQVHKSAKMAQIDDFIKTLPAGYDELTGERGVRLSGGQRQRIGIARALYQNPSLIVFDEATSALDNKTEQDVMLAIDNLKQDLTVILIAHRLSTVKKADNILLFDKGRLVAQGTYSQLLENAHFKELVKSAELD